ncbi:MAG: M24 family metallopeptidase [Gemmataceae bacterium]
MLTADGCRQRRQRLWSQLDPKPDSDHLRLSDPIHLNYLTGFCVDPVSLNAGFGATLILRPDGRTRLLCDNRLKSYADAAHVDDRVLVSWYDGQTPGGGPRQLALLAGVNPAQRGFRIHDRLGDPYAATLVGALARMRRRKDADEIALLRRCMKATEAGHAWARANVKPGMTELDVYAGISAACNRSAAKPVVVYGDFAVSPGPERRGGPPTGRVLAAGDLMILDFSVVIDGYRSDFTNTLCVGGDPNPDQQRLYDLCMLAIAAGEARLKAGAECQDVYRAVRGTFDDVGLGDAFPHHAGHGLGLTHPEAPFFVRQATETLRAGDVVTLEPGLYIAGVGGIRIEHNYLITGADYERLSNHAITLV